MTTEEVFSVLQQLKDLGTEIISFTGGEPFIRNDLDHIVEYARKLGLMVSVNTNGSFVKKFSNKIHKIPRLTISLDGPDEINAITRGKNTHKQVMDALEICCREGVRVCLSTVISKQNVKCLGAIINVANKYNCKVLFQPAASYKFGLRDEKMFGPDFLEYRQAIDNLIILKRKQSKLIFNSLSGLEHLKKWPEPALINCAASKLHCRIDCNGDMFPCSRRYDGSSNCIDNTVERAFNLLKKGGCRECWCASLIEFNLLTSFNISSIVNMLGLF